MDRKPQALSVILSTVFVHVLVLAPFSALCAPAMAAPDGADETFTTVHESFLHVAQNDQGAAGVLFRGPVPGSGPDHASGELEAYVTLPPLEWRDTVLAATLEAHQYRVDDGDGPSTIDPFARTVSIDGATFVTPELLIDAELGPGFHSDKRSDYSLRSFHLEQQITAVYGVTDTLQLLAGELTLNLEQGWGFVPFAGFSARALDDRLWVQVVVPLRAEVSVDLGAFQPYVVLEGDEERFRSFRRDSDHAVLARDRWAAGIEWRLYPPFAVTVEAGEFFNTSVKAAGAREFLGSSPFVGIELAFLGFE